MKSNNDVPQERIDREHLKRLSRSTGTPIEELIALNPAADPFYTGSAYDRRLATWFKTLVEGHGLVGYHHRDIHYGLLSLGADYSESEWLKLLKGSAKARALGLFSPWAFPDHRSRLYLTDGRSGDEPNARLPELHVPGEPWSSEGEWEVEPMTFQPIRVAVFCEKAGDFLNEIHGPCEEFGAGLRVTIGLSARTTAGEVVRDAIADGRPTVALWVSDADSTGETMPLAMARHIEHIVSRYEAPPIYVGLIALTLPLVEEIESEYGVEIPLAPDVRRSEGRVEVNALPFYAAGWLERRTREMLEELTADIEIDTSLEMPELDERLKTLHDEAVELYEPISERMQEIEQEIERLREEAEAPQFVQPDSEMPDLDRDWILDPERGYIEQLNAYRRHSAAHHDSTPLTLQARKCPVCGDPMLRRAVQARYCSDRCRSRARAGRNAGR